MRRLLLLGAALVLSTTHLPAQVYEQDLILANETTLKNAFQDTDGESLVKFLTTRARGKADPKTIDKLLQDLESKKASDRQKACQQLVAIGSPVMPHLRLFVREAKGDAAVLSKKVMDIIDDEPTSVPGAAIRLLAVRKPAGAAEALLAYLPHTQNDSELQAARLTLASFAYVEGKPNPALLKALEDPNPVRRANAIEALCARGTGVPRLTLRKLMTDKSPSVRMRAALALAKANDPKAVSVLIALLADVRWEQAEEIEAFLSELAGDEAPKVTGGADELSRQKFRDAWAKWWLGRESPALLKELEKRTLTNDARTRASRLIEKLGDDSGDVRQEAEADLKKMGAMVLPLLK